MLISPIFIIHEHFQLKIKRNNERGVKQTARQRWIIKFNVLFHIDFNWSVGKKNTNYAQFYILSLNMNLLPMAITTRLHFTSWLRNLPLRNDLTTLVATMGVGWILLVGPGNSCKSGNHADTFKHARLLSPHLVEIWTRSNLNSYLVITVK